MMSRTDAMWWMSVIGTACWILCFWWMHRISSRQNNLLAQLTDQAKRVERLSKAEHDLIKEVHPQVNDIKESMDVVRMAVTPEPPPPQSAPVRNGAEGASTNGG